VKKVFLIIFQPAVVMFLFGCRHHAGIRPREGWDHMMEYGGYGVMLMWLILIILVGIIIYVVIIRGRRSGDWRDQVSENPVEILKRRYAKGEISKEDFERQKKDLES